MKIPWRDLIESVGPSVVATTIIIAITSGVQYSSEKLIWPLWLMSAMFLGITIAGAVLVLRNPTFRIKIGGPTFIITGRLDVDSMSGEIKSTVGEVISSWPIDYRDIARSTLNHVTVLISEKNGFIPEGALGATAPDIMTSYVRPDGLGMGVLGWELHLQVANKLWPGLSEGQKRIKMLELGVV